MSMPTLDPELLRVLKHLRLGMLAITLPQRIVLAQKDGMDLQAFLLLVLSDEVSRRNSSAGATRVRLAGLDPDMTLERWDPTAKVTYDKRMLQELATLRFIEQRRHVVILGPVGTGKTFIANALGHLACHQRHTVKFARADDTLRRLRQSRLDNSRDALLAELIAVDLLILDDFGLDSMSRDESRDVYQLFVERTGRASTIVTSNRDTAEWLALFDEGMRAQSAVDRFKNAAYDLIIDGESYRPRLKPSLEVPPDAAKAAPKSRR
jgi:DNA replication protein DnaC